MAAAITVRAVQPLDHMPSCVGVHRWACHGSMKHKCCHLLAMAGHVLVCRPPGGAQAGFGAEEDDYDYDEQEAGEEAGQAAGVSFLIAHLNTVPVQV